MDCKEILFSEHAITQMFKRDLSVDNVLFILKNGETIATYLYDKPYPSYLLLGYLDSRPVHIVVGKEESAGKCVIITAYEPDITIWQAGFKNKKD